MTQGVIVDAGYKDARDLDSFWFHLYVMLSRATSSDNLLVIRGPGVEFLSRGPPKDLASRLGTLECVTKRCRRAVEKQAHDLGLTAFLHAPP